MLFEYSFYGGEDMGIRKFWMKKKDILATEQGKLIKKELERMDKENLHYLMSLDDLHKPHTFTPEFEKRMEDLFNRNNAIGNKKTISKYSSLHIPRTAVVALCAIMVTVVFVGIKTEAIPFPKFSYTLRKEEGSYAYLIEQEDYVKNKIEDEYEMTFIQNDYELIKTTKFKKLYYEEYRNDLGNSCIFQQFTKTAIVKVDDIMNNFKEMIFGESRYYIMERNGFKNILWYANGYQFIIQVDLSINMNDLVKMAQSIKKK